MFFNRYWSHIQDFEDFVGRIFIICRCPPFPKLAKKLKSIYEKYVLKWFHDLSCIFWSLLLGLSWPPALVTRPESRQVLRQMLRSIKNCVGMFHAQAKYWQIASAQRAHMPNNVAIAPATTTPSFNLIYSKTIFTETQEIFHIDCRKL